VAQGVAIKNGRILAVGSELNIAAYIGPETEVIDAGGRAITPGLIDPHIHVRVLGLTNVYYQPFMPPEVSTVQDMQRLLAEYCAQTPPGEWIQGYYLVLSDKGIPTRDDLDAVSPDHPVFIMQMGGHFATANSLGLKLAGITDSTASPEGGLIEKDDSGRLTGVFYNHRAMDVLRRVIPPASEDMVLEGLLKTLPMLAAVGVTSFHDNNVRSLEQMSVYQKAAEMGKMLIRGALYLTLEWPGDMEKAASLVPFADEKLRFAGYKFLIDGQAPSAFTRQPHDGATWTLPTWEP